MAHLRRGLWLLVFVAALVGGWQFAGSNSTPVRIDYLYGQSTLVPFWLALLLSFGAGAAVTALALFARLTRSSLAQRRYRKTVAALESEVHQLRNLPVGRSGELAAIAEVPVPAPVGGETDVAPEPAKAAH